jgi:class 3 adenylate cyclase
MSSPRAPHERKPVTVLFADLAGSTALAVERDPEELRALLAAFFDEMRQAIESFGGLVEKYAGDAIMAVFGVPRVHEDDAMARSSRS